MRTIRYKLLEYFENGTVQLFNLRDDMGEQNDLSKIEGRKDKELTAKLHQWRKDVDAQMMPPNPDYDIALDPWSGKETSKGSRIVNSLGYMNTSTQKLIVTCMALLCLSSPARSGETLYNGIVLPDGFPLPAKEGGRKPKVIVSMTVI